MSAPAVAADGMSAATGLKNMAMMNSAAVTREARPVYFRMERIASGMTISRRAATFQTLGIRKARFRS